MTPQRDAFSLTANQLEELTRLAGDLLEEAHRCADAGCWRAALLLIASSVEAGLLGTVCACEPELRQSGYLSRRGILDMDLRELTTLARRAGWLPTVLDDKSRVLFSALDGEVGDAVEFVRQIRNMTTHPGAYVRQGEDSRPDFDNEQHTRPTYDIFCGIADMIFERLTAAVATIRPPDHQG